jgi:PP-loop superfamily ATP-utilizing enzyme
MPYKNPDLQREYIKRYYLRTRKNKQELIQHKKFDEIMDEKYNNIVAENKRLKRYIFLHNIRATDDIIQSEEPKEETITLHQHKAILKELIQKWGEEYVNKKLEQYEAENYPFEECRNTLEKCEFYSGLILFFE